MSTLQQRVRPDLEVLLPPAVQQRIPADALAWFTQLGAGGYKAVATTLPGRSGSLFLTSTVAIENPPSAAAGVLMRPIPQRPPDKRRLLATIDMDYAELHASSSPGRVAWTKSELDAQQLLVSERRNDVLAALTPDERAEYEFRFEGSTADNAMRFALMEATEHEFRAIKPMLDELQRRTAELRTGDPNSRAAQVELEQLTIDQLVATLGYERAIEYCWAGRSGPYAPTVRLMRERNLPTLHAAQLLQLAAETGVEGAAIHHDETLTVEQKRGALAELQTKVRPRLDALVPPAVQSLLDKEAIDWFTALGDGRYATFRPIIFASGWYTATPIPVTTPTRSPRQVVPLPRRGF